jgi:hypothetical protein
VISIDTERGERERRQKLTVNKTCEANVKQIIEIERE